MRHNRSQLVTRLPAEYVQISTGLGYATTIHGAQGVTADTMHGLLTGQESRQQLYTMLTRGRRSNQLYLQVVGDGDPHTLIRPDTNAPCTPTERLQQILARDDTPTSATAQLRDLHDPATRLFDAVQRYTDALHVAAEQLIGSQTVTELDQADRHIPGLTSEPAWPTLRAHLLTLAVETGQHPLQHLRTVASGRDLTSVSDKAAVLDWRLTPPEPAGSGPLPWLPALPAALASDPVWGDYLAKRSQLVADLADQVHHHAIQSGAPLAWADANLSAGLVGDVAVWRAATGIDTRDPRATGGPQLETARDAWTQHLEREIARFTDPSEDARVDAHTRSRRKFNRSHEAQRPHQKADRHPSFPSGPSR